MEFIRAVGHYTFLQYALITGLLVSVSCGIIGTYVIMRRISYIAGGIAHCVLGGLGAANYLNKVCGWSFLDPLYGAVAAALLAAFIIGFVSIRAKEREDTVIGALWALGMAVGVLFISRTPGYNEDLMSYLFGNILMVKTSDILLIATLDVVVAGAGLLLYNQFMGICFDEEFARVRGINVEFYYLLLLCLTALTVVLTVSVVGVIMVIALLTLPVAVAGHFSGTLWKIMGLSVLLSMLFTTAGLAVSYSPNLPAGATIIVVAGACYLVVTAASRLLRRRKIKRSDISS